MIEELRTRTGTPVTSANHPENLPQADSGAPFDGEHLGGYLGRLLGVPVEVHSVSPLRDCDQTRRPGTGAPLKVEYSVGNELRRAVLERVAPEAFGIPSRSDRIPARPGDLRITEGFPRHARALDVGAVEGGEELRSLGRSEEFFLLTEFVEGRAYGEDLVRLKLGGPITSLDRARVDALSDYLVEVHRERGPDPELYVHRLRELLGLGDGILGLTDSYPLRHDFIVPEMLQRLEHRCLEWRWRLKRRTHRLRRIHGNLHPWNLLFREGTDFRALYRSGGTWGEPAADVTCLTMNYVFFALQSRGCARKGLLELFRRFWGRYLEKTGDVEMLEVAAPFFAVQSLGLASPSWHPCLGDPVRRDLFSFMVRILEAAKFDPDRVEECLSD
jgi:hypothetical protein